MRFSCFLAFFCVLLISIETVFGREFSKTKSLTDSLKKLEDKSAKDRRKRSLDEDGPNRGKKRSTPDNFSDVGRIVKVPKNDLMNKEPPFWGSRGRRDSASFENDINEGHLLSKDSIFYPTSYCKNCYKIPFKDVHDDIGHQKELREEQDVPFWGNRGRRNSDETEDINYASWDPRGKAEEEDPFWGARGRREDEVPFWGNRGRRQDWKTHDNAEDPPFWGNRGRRDEIEPFWGSRGRRQELEPFSTIHSIDDKNIRRESLKKILRDAINTVEDNIESLTRVRRNGMVSTNSIRGSSSLSNLFKLGRQRYQIQKILEDDRTEFKTMQNEGFFAEQPRFILVERSSRSSGEDDPYFISRGKKMLLRFEPSYSSRPRRGSLEELVKSVRNDPYYIARGKKYAPASLIGNSTAIKEDFAKTQELICATIDMILHNKGNKNKREIDDNDRDRRTILKKLAAQLQIDPYFVSRGKKNESDFNEENLEDFIKQVSGKCN